MSTQEVLFGQATFIGADNYQRLWDDRIFWKALFNSTRYMVLTIVLLIPCPLVLAAMINSKIGSARVKAVFKASMFVPALTSIVVAGHPLPADVLGVGHRPDEPGRRVLRVRTRSGGSARTSVGSRHCWRWRCGATRASTCCTSSRACSRFPTEYYEAASIDGASRVQQFFHITHPESQADHRLRHDDQHLRRPGDVPRELHALRRQQLPEQPGADRRGLPLPQGDRGERPRASPLPWVSCSSSSSWRSTSRTSPSPGPSRRRPR